MSGSGVTIDRQQVRLDRPIKTVGLHVVRISLHPEVAVGITVNVARSDEEARTQAEGRRPGDEDDPSVDPEGPEPRNRPGTGRKLIFAGVGRSVRLMRPARRAFLPGSRA